MNLSLNIALIVAGLTNDPKPITFEKQIIAMETAESAGVFDVDADGHPDIVSGSYWYKGPEFPSDS